jgi:hypothetical protein
MVLSLMTIGSGLSFEVFVILLKTAASNIFAAMPRIRSLPPPDSVEA